MDDEFDARLRQALRDRAEQVGPPDDVLGEIRRRSARRRRRQNLAVWVAAVMILAVPVTTALPRLLSNGEQEVVLGAGTSLKAEAPPPGQTVEVPPQGQARGAAFDNGTPVLVVHDPRGQVHVFDARSPDKEPGRRGQLGWCGQPAYSGGQLVDPVTGHRWRPDGSPMVVESDSVHPDGDAPPQLLAYEVQGEPEGGVVEVGQPSPMKATLDKRETEEEALPPVPEPCSTSEVVTPPLPGDPADVGDLHELPDGTYHVSATLEQVGDEPARLCALPQGMSHLRALLRPPRPDHLKPPLCDEATSEAIEVRGEVGGQEEGPHLAHVRAGRFGVSMSNGEVYRLTIPASNMRPRSVPVSGEVVLAGSLQPPGPDRGGGPARRPSSEVEDTDVGYKPSPPEHPVPLHPLVAARADGGAQVEAVGLRTNEVVEGPTWFSLDTEDNSDYASEYAPEYVPAGRHNDFWLPLAPDAEITADGESLNPDELASRVEDGDLEGHEATVTVDRASGLVSQVRSREG